MLTNEKYHDFYRRDIEENLGTRPETKFSQNDKGEKFDKTEIGFKMTYKAMFGCEYDKSNPDIPCRNLRFSPWAMLQYIIQLHKGNPEDLSTINKEKTEELPVEVQHEDQAVVAHKQEEELRYNKNDPEGVLETQAEQGGIIETKKQAREVEEQQETGEEPDAVEPSEPEEEGSHCHFGGLLGKLFC